MSSSRSYWESLAWSSFLARCLGLSLPDLVGVDSLGEDLSTDAFVHNDPDCSLGHVEDTSSLSVVGLVGHTLLESTATFHINNISNLVELEISGQMLDTLLLVGSGEHVSGATTVSCWVRHL